MIDFGIKLYLINYCLMITNFISNIINPIKLIIYNLYMAVWSLDFYNDIRKRYIGYGFRYITAIVCLGAIAWLFAKLSMFKDVNDYLTRNKLESQTGLIIDNILSKWPEIYYDNQQISLLEPTPYLITDDNHTILIAIDPESKITGAEISNILIVMAKDNIQIVDHATGRTTKIFYNSILGNKKLLIDSSYIKNLLTEVFQKKYNIILLCILMLYPLVVLGFLIFIAFDNIIIIVTIGTLINFFTKCCSIKDICRLGAFSSAPAILIAIMIIAFNPKYLWISDYVQIWCNFIAISSLVKSEKTTV
ncbi:Uncharacterised protein [Orientia tsutsugamushi]|uniref:DUF1189 domain-containing protein n=2 Tax=Orientia tsutsugamushi TaxID=784 RepID=A0A2U3RMP5_ORITS|nr:DUF1189 family protein [Orientia tsutsugamushi]KJV55343.1 putative membrane protein [Orientia tsutsugamushi str. Karp]SPR14505.1 Uncharacterised protein [Orientia tsutsugamushi]